MESQTLDLRLNDEALDKIAGAVDQRIGGKLTELVQSQTNEDRDLFALAAQELGDEEPGDGMILELLRGGKVRKLSEEDLHEREYAPAGQTAVGKLERSANRALPGGVAGSILIGGGSALFAAEVLDGLVPREKADNSINMTNVAIKALGLAAALGAGQRVASRTAAVSAATVFGVELAAQLLPVDTWVQKAVDWIKGIKSGSAGQDVSAGSPPEAVYERAPAGQERPIDTSPVGANPVLAQLRRAA